MTTLNFECVLHLNPIFTTHVDVVVRCAISDLMVVQRKGPGWTKTVQVMREGFSTEVSPRLLVSSNLRRSCTSHAGLSRLPVVPKPADGSLASYLPAINRSSWVLLVARVFASYATVQSQSLLGSPRVIPSWHSSSHKWFGRLWCQQAPSEQN